MAGERYSFDERDGRMQLVFRSHPRTGDYAQLGVNAVFAVFVAASPATHSLFSINWLLTVLLISFWTFIAGAGLREGFGLDTVAIDAQRLTRTRYLVLPFWKQTFLLSGISNLRYVPRFHAYRQISQPSGIAFDYEFMPRRLFIWLDEGPTNEIIHLIISRYPQLGAASSALAQCRIVAPELLFQQLTICPEKRQHPPRMVHPT
jgi:hypothetical protein